MPDPSLYPNAPLLEAVFEIRFPGEPAVECHRDEFFALVRGEFPMVWVPHLEAGQSPALSPYHFRSADEKSSLMIAINRFAYSTRTYTGFASFKREAMKHTAAFVQKFGLQKLNRTGLRYVNIIPFNREQGLLPIERYFQFRVEVPPAKSSQVSNLSLGYSVPREDGSLTIRIECVASPDQRPAFLLDFDYAKEKELTVDHLEKYIDESHQETKLFFETIVTDEYRNFMRGEVVE